MRQIGEVSLVVIKMLKAVTIHTAALTPFARWCPNFGTASGSERSLSELQSSGTLATARGTEIRTLPFGPSFLFLLLIHITKELTKNRSVGPRPTKSVSNK